MNDELQHLKNLGKTSAQWLHAVGIHSANDLRRLGAVSAYRAVRARGFRASKVLLYAIEGALLDVSARAGLALDFHVTLAAAVAEVMHSLQQQTGIKKAVLSGGVFQNRLLLEATVAALQGEFTVLLNRQVPPNDGGIAFGQAAVALAHCGGRQ